MSFLNSGEPVNCLLGAWAIFIIICFVVAFVSLLISGHIGLATICLMVLVVLFWIIKAWRE